MSMETSGFRPDHHHHHNHHHQSHVPQQSRRDKLRVQQGLSPTPISHGHFDNMDHHHHHHLQHEFTFHQDHVNNNARHHNNFLYDGGLAMVNHHPSEILDFSRTASRSSNSRTFHDMSHDVVPQSLMFSWSNERGLNNVASTAPSFETWPVVAAARPRSTNSNNVVAQPCVDVGHKYYLEGMNLGSTHGGYNNDEDNIVTVASTRDMIRSENELALLPFSFANIDSSTSSCATHHQSWKEQEDHHNHHLRTTVVNDTNLQGLSLSLSSINPSNPATTATFPGLASSDSDQELPKPIPTPKPSIISKSCGKSLQDIVGVSSGGFRSNTGPLGPFTGYATILRSSRFLKPAQQLLDEFCGSKLPVMTKAGGCDASSSERLSGDVGLDNHNNAMDQDHQVAVATNSSNNEVNVNACSGSSSMLYGSNNSSCDQRGGGVNIDQSGSSRPEHVQQKKAKLLYMQEEVSRRYKQYKQQMQMVVSSFESVAGLSSATPYITLALKAVSRHFRCLKSAIAEQLNHTRRALGEDYLLSTPTTSASKASSSSLRLKYMDQQSSMFQSNNNKPGSGGGAGSNMAFHEPQQHHIWRPQRGLPERSVAVLRAWLFDHFLHPYPTDTDKHMLATQTGLTRNQVSNWFINARVRVWKPMVEEIHTLETKGHQADQVVSSKFVDGINMIPSSSKDHLAQASSTNKLGNIQLECAGDANFATVGHSRSSVLLGADQHDEQSQEKRSRLEGSSSHTPPSSLPGSVVQGFVPYHRAGLEVWSRAEQ